MRFIVPLEYVHGQKTLNLLIFFVLTCKVMQIKLRGINIRTKTLDCVSNEYFYFKFLYEHVSFRKNQEDIYFIQ